MRKSFLLNCLLVVALLFGAIGPLSAAPLPLPSAAPIALPVSEPDAPGEPTATDAFAPYAHWQGSTDAYISVPHDAALNPQDGATFEAWVFPSNLSGCRAIFGKNYLEGYWVGLCNGRIRYHSAGNASYQDGVTAILPNVWTHIAVVWDPVFNVRRYFINGDFDYIGAAGPAPTGNRELRIGGDQPWDSFAGFIAEARIWNVARDQADIRRTLNSYVDEKVPGLVASWPFRANHTDIIGGRAGTANGTQKGILFVGTDSIHPFPLRPQTVDADQLFNSLPQRRDSMGSAYLPGWDRTLLIGGNVDGVESNRIDAVNGGTGDLTVLGSLPVTLRNPGAAYAPETGKVYIFGGSSGGVDQSAIYAVDPATGAANPIPATLPEAVDAPAAVYHPGLGKIFVLGGVVNGTDPLDRVSVFDPATETLTPANFALPVSLSMLAAAYSSATGSLFTFGGLGAGGAAVDSIYELQASGDGTTGSITPAPASLAVADGGLAAVEDGESKLIYLLGGALSDRVLAFDPLLGQLWKTPGELPALRYRPAALYSPANRHALLIGGFGGGLGQTNVWKFSLGDGPGVKLGRWDFEYASGTVNAISGAADRVFIGTTSGASARSDGGTVYYGPNDLGGSNVRLVEYDVARGRVYFVVDTNRIVYESSNGIFKLWPDSGETDKVLDFTPYGNSPVIATQINTSVPQGYPSLYWRWGLGGLYTWHASWNGCQSSSGLVNRASNQIWGLVTEHDVCGPRSIGPQPRQADAYGDVYMQGLTYSSVTGTFSEFDYGKICVDGAFVPNQMAFGKNGDFWAAGSTGVCRYPAATVPGTFGVDWKYNVMNTPTGPSTSGPAVDGDGRVWFGVNKDATHSGGLTVFEVLGKNPNRQSVWTTDYTWLNAPIGSKNASGAADYNSSVSAVYANGERVWSARGGEIFTIAQRWQQLDERNDLRDKALTGIWTVRGRLFVATADELAILQPDGITWENWAVAGVKAVVADSTGRIWAGGTDGVGIYTGAGGFVTPPSPTAAPAGPITALAVDGTGRVWIGSAAGVTLYDRGRFVTTLTPATGGGVSSLLADRNDNLWVGTDAGLNRFSPGDATWTTFTTANGLPSNDIGDLVQLPSGWLAIAHSLGVTQYRGGTDFVSYSISGNKLPLTVDDKGRLWASGSVVDGNAWQGYTWANSGLRANAVADNAADGADRVWFAHPNGGVSVRGSTLPPLSEQVPLISGINPTAGSAGNDIHILGSGFGTDRTALDVTIGGKPVEIIAATDTDVTVRLGPDNTSGRVSLLKNRKRRTSASDLFCAIPVISGVTPSGGNAGVEVTVTGTNFDPGAVVTLGGGSHTPYPSDTKRLVTRIASGDATGFARVINHCGNSDQWVVPFNKVDLSISRLVLNQGIPDQPLIYARPTFIQSYLRRSVEVRATDKLEISQVEVTFTDPRNNATISYSRPYSGAVPTSGNSAPSGALLADVVNSVNVWNIGPIGGTGFVDGNLQVAVALKNRNATVAESSQTVRFARNVPLRVVLVPIMKEGYSADELNNIKTNVDRNLLAMNRRIMPTGDVEFIWSNDVHTDDETLSLDNFFTLYNYAPRLDRARSRWNDRSNSDALIAFGVVDPRIVSGGVDGYGLWPDASEMANLLFLDALDTLCDAANTALEIVSFGFLGSDDGCHLEIPLYIGWARGDAGTDNADVNGMKKGQQSSYLFAHEIGHTLGMVKPWATNGSLDDNLSHSINDEIGPLGDFDDPSKSCNDFGAGGGVFDWGLSLYTQPGVRNPIVDPITGAQLYSQNNGNAWTPRAKSMMSYACAKYNYNSFFEPIDAAMIRGTIGGGTLAVAATRAADQSDAPARTFTPRELPGQRLHIAGTVEEDGQSGVFTRVEPLGESAPLGLPFNTGYWLVQVNGAGAEMNRLGIYPVFQTIHKHEDPNPQPHNTTGFFAATLLMADGVAAVQLRHDDAVLATFAPGSAAPQVNISSPAGGAFAAGEIPVAWNATDGDGDALEVAVDYSTDGGVTWQSVASATGSGDGTASLPVGALAGSADARIRVTASDGLRTASATSPAFTVTAQPPRPFIAQPLPDAPLREGQLVELAGGAGDNQDGFVDPTNLRWRSDRDGDLGSGVQRSVGLSVGTHLLTLAATNSAGMATQTAVTVTVQGDYDGDTILDTVEAADGLNPLTPHDAYSDADGDGLPLVMERNWGTNPALADSDGDTRTDDAEIGAGTNPMVNDAPLAADSLRVLPAVGLEFSADLSLDTAPAQQRIQVVSRESAPWTISFDVPWLATSAAEGNTPAAPTILIQPAGLTDGVHTGNLFVNGGALGQVSLPVTVTISHKASYCDTNQDEVTDQADVDGVSARLGSQDGDENYNYHYDLNRDGAIDSQDVALVTACVTGSAPTYRLYLPTTSRETVSAPSTLLVYGDGLASGWADWSWSSAVDFASSGQVKVGTKAIAITHNAGNGGFSVRTATPLDGGQYSAIRFWIYGNGKPLVLYTQSSDDGGVSPFYRFTPPAGVWAKYSAPLSALGSPAKIARINLQDESGAAQSIYYLDELEVVAK